MFKNLLFDNVVNIFFQQFFEGKKFVLVCFDFLNILRVDEQLKGIFRFSKYLINYSYYIY